MMARSQMGENLHRDYVGESVGKAFPHICGLSVSLAIQDLKSAGVCFTNTTLVIWSMLAQHSHMSSKLALLQENEEGHH